MILAGVDGGVDQLLHPAVQVALQIAITAVAVKRSIAELISVFHLLLDEVRKFSRAAPDQSQKATDCAP